MCPFSGDLISFEALFRDTRFDTEFIIPRDRGLDDSWTNRTICRRDIALEKHGRTPLEWCAATGRDVDSLRCSVARSGLPEFKARQFFIDPPGSPAHDAGEDHALREVRWPAAAVRDFVGRLYAADRGSAVEIVKRSIASQLARAWDLEATLGCNAEANAYDDHRRAAVLALASALTCRAAIADLARAYRDLSSATRPSLPWASLQEDAARAISAIVVSHRVQRKASGQLHAESFYGDTGVDNRSASTTYRAFVIRKPVERLSASELDDVRDPRIRDILHAHVAAHGGDPRSAFPPYPMMPSADGRGTAIRRVRIILRQQLATMVELPHGFADPAANHHMAIFERLDGAIDVEVVTRFEASRRLRRREAVVRRTDPTGARFIMSLSPGDMLAFPRGDGPPDRRVVVSVWAAGQVVLADHRSVRREIWKRPNAASILKAGAFKISVDPIGRISLPRD